MSQPKQTDLMKHTDASGAVTNRPVRSRMMRHFSPPSLPDILQRNGSHIITVKDGKIVESRALEDSGDFLLTVNARRVVNFAAVEKGGPLVSNNGDGEPGEGGAEPGEGGAEPGEGDGKDGDQD